jgi:hypothetical protein
MEAEHPHARVQHLRGSPKVTAFCALSKKIYGPFFFTAKTLTGTVYLDILQNWLMPRLNIGFGENLIFQQDAAPSSYHNVVSRFLIGNLTGR